MGVFKPKRVQRHHITGAMIVAGIGVAMLSVLESRVPWIAAFCGLLGDGCRDTARYRLLGLPVAPWGVVYYAFLGLLYLRIRSLLFWGIMAGVGFELVLVGIMLDDRFFCVFCAANLLLVAILWICQFDRKKTWEMVSAILLSFTVGGFLVSDSNGRMNARKAAGRAESVLARVGTREITAEDVERPLISEIHKVRQKIYGMKKQVLDVLIEEVLLEQEAKEAGMSVEALIEEVRGRIAPPGPHVVDHYYESKLYRQWGTAEGSEEEIKNGIREYLHNRDGNQLVDEYCRRLREKYPVDVFLTAPPLPLTQMRIDGAPALGPSDAPVTVVELSDYLCPVCRKGHGTVQKIKEKYEGKIRWVFKDYPLERHPGAKELALAAKCAHAQGKFWAYQDLLFSAGKKPGLKEAMAYAEELGLNSSRFRECLADPGFVEALEQDIANIREAGIGSTPSFIVNGRLRPGMPSFDEFSEMIDSALKEAEIGSRLEK